ncbi:MAG: homoserine dehydrogenase [Oceanococcus sp.]
MSLKIGLLGLGTVGSGCVKVLRENAQEINARAGQTIQIVRAAVRDPSQSRDCDLSGIAIDSDADGLVADPNVDVVVELMGGTGRARELVLAALANGKSVVTANKALIAEHGGEIFAAASAANCKIAFEAAVAGGIPIIKALREGLSANRVDEIAGIINGTTNFILSRMEADGAAFADVLAEAQALGYAEADPTFDVEGIDAGHKLAILATLAFDIPLATDQLHTIGVGVVSAQDIRYASEQGYRIKHLAIARRSDAGVELRVEPTLVPKAAFVAKVDGVMNGVSIKGNAVGSTGFYGPGAGGMATASAVVADIVDVALGRALPSPPMANSLPIVAVADVVSAHYLRMQVRDEPGVLKTISSILAALGISIEAMVQKEINDKQAEVVLITHEVSTGILRQALDELAGSGVVQGTIVQMRVEHLSE